MSPFCVILAACTVLLLGTVAFLVMIAVGVRNGDRGDLISPPRNCVDAIARYVTGVGVRHCGTDNGERRN